MASDPTPLIEGMLAKFPGIKLTYKGKLMEPPPPPPPVKPEKPRKRRLPPKGKRVG